ncbi:MAG: helix-turn-helix domain-containing protein [Clostridia bacterium]|nr:helix-turn-helix domain-containing protein [Clostridia bacterium]MBQ5355673.1 helix-turn-helix domain-containing protein [Clostridia bacterium]
MADVFRHADYVTGGPAVGIVPAEHDGRIRAHSHDFHEIVYVVDGFTLHQAGGVITLLVAGDLFFVRPGEEHSYINAYQTKLYNLIFEESELGSFLPELSALPGLDVMFGTRGKGTEAEGQSIRLLHVPMNERRNIESALREIEAEREARRVGWETSLKIRLAAFLLRYSRMYAEEWDNRAPAADDYYGYVYRILAYVDTHYSENITMNDLSAELGLSPDYMARKFKSALRMTPSEYVRKFRIARAMELLVTTDLPVAEVAKRTGFSDVSLFSRVFKQSVGLPPASYRKNAGEWE